MKFKVGDKVSHVYFGNGHVSDSNHEHKRLCIIFDGGLVVVCSIYNLELINETSSSNDDASIN
ncbi:Uncharacterised protein [Providencia rettgeri]|uniref:Uncharacterized protein n=1 Tax=Providencia rettgeri TaxID=587 RepID=A0A9N8D5M3_PRORE|nr:Uncharacterised protein [Providencia rettgeri]CAB5709390.1 Uncharacterised protein [Providencia rettgeri]CAC9186522.1 Uncharacterised protein [Providencia rettgeri]CAC9226708.1 Uncharacterised protein [Providencia rettgeri]